MWGSHLIPLMCLWRCQLGWAATCWLLQLLMIVCTACVVAHAYVTAHHAPGGGQLPMWAYPKVALQPD